MNLQKKLLCVIFALVLCLVPLLTLLSTLHHPTGWSVQENRALASVPELSLSALWSGETAAQTESFFKDHLYHRDSLLKLDVWVQMHVLRRPVVQDVVLGEDVLLPAAEIADYRPTVLAKKADAMADSLAAIQSAAESVGGQFCYVLVPEQRSALRDLYPGWMENRSEQYDAIRTAFTAAMAEAGVPLLDLFDVYQTNGSPAQYYSAVDHHYNLRGAALAYETLCTTFALPFFSPDVQETDNPFVGTYNRKLYGLSPVSEQMQTDLAAAMDYERWDNGEQTDRPLIELAADHGDCYYTAYMGGDIGETIVQTSRPALGKVLLVGDSFTNALEPLLYRSFGEMRSLDYRHYSEKSLTDYIRDYQPDLVLILRDDISCLTTGGNGSLE